ncbi:MAG: hypothetical protein J4G12_02235 [Gemmatimonadetes bacterium]|nr:hypothetical protein [Gemmatimonadota bacterium]
MTAPVVAVATAVSLTMTAFAGGDASAIPAGPNENELARQEAWRTSTISRDYDGDDGEPLRVRVSYGGGTLTLTSGEVGVLYRMEVRYNEEHQEPVAEVGDGLVELGIESFGDKFNLGRSGDNGSLDLRLGSDVPMMLEVAFGAGRAAVDVGGLSLSGLSVETGASSIRLEASTPNRMGMDAAEFAVGAADFEANDLGNLRASRVSVDAGVGKVVLGLGGDWRENATLRVDMGVGSLTLRVPRGLGLRVDRDGFLTTFDSEGLTKRGDSYYSPDWEDAERRVRVELDAAFGRVALEWFDPDEE